MVVLNSGISVLGQAPATAFYISIPLVLVDQLHANGNGGSTATLSDAVVEHIVAEVESSASGARSTSYSAAVAAGGGGRVMTTKPTARWRRLPPADLETLILRSSA